jgi:hypothetical protein
MVDQHGDTDYDKLSTGVKGSLVGSDEYSKEVDYAANSTENHDLTDFPIKEGTFVYIQVIVKSGSTDLNLSIHQDTKFTAEDMVFRVTGASTNDAEPTGGFPSSANGIPYHEQNDSAELHIQTVENSGTAGTVLVKIDYIKA